MGAPVGINSVNQKTQCGAVLLKSHVCDKLGEWFHLFQPSIVKIASNPHPEPTCSGDVKGMGFAPLNEGMRVSACLFGMASLLLSAKLGDLVRFDPFGRPMTNDLFHVRDFDSDVGNLWF